MTTDQTIEDDIQAAGKTAARITPADIENNIIGEHFFTAAQGVAGARAGASSFDLQFLMLLTFCVLVLDNGFTVTGESACASPENFDADIGKKIARANAVQKIWPLMGYELRTALAGTPPPLSNAFVAPGCEQFTEPAASTFQDRVRTERADLAEKLVKLGEFKHSPVWAGLEVMEQSRLMDQAMAMADYLEALDARIAAFEPVHAVG